MRKFEIMCQNEALRTYGKRYADLTDSQCAEISKKVRKKLDKQE